MSERTNCADCGTKLTDNERTYYGATCERCEGVIWALGASDELPPPVRCPWGRFQAREGHRVKEHGILFSAPMVRAILAGTKTQTRRIVSTTPRGWDAQAMELACVQEHDSDMLGVQAYFGDKRAGTRCPYGKSGDRLWVREAWRTTGDGGRCNGIPPRDLQPHEVWYEADGAAPAHELVGKLRPGMFMPRWASRITLEVTSVRVEKLGDISEADAEAEGAAPLLVPPDGGSSPHVEGFRYLWESINGLGSWDASPWVWCVSFRRLP